MSVRTYLIGIILLGIGYSICFGIINGTIFRTEFSDYLDDAEVYNSMAMGLVERGTVLGEHGEYYGWGRRSPGYPLFLAVAYAVYPYPVSAWVLQEILFAGTILIFFYLARIILRDSWALITTFLFSIAWFTATFVLHIGSDFLGMALGMLVVLLLYRGIEHKSALLFFVGGCVLGAFALVRPIMLYSAVAFSAYIVWVLYSYGSSMRKITGVAFSFLCGVVVVVGPWMWWSYEVFHTPQLASAGYILAWRSRDALWSYPRMAVSGTAALFGDVVADYFSPGYASYPDPYPQKDQVIERRLAMQKEGIPESTIDSFFYKEGVSNIISHPLMFGITGGINLIRLYTIPNQHGVASHHFLAESPLPLGLRIGINIGIRVVWFFLVVFAVWSLIRYMRTGGRAVFAYAVALLIVYLSGMQAMLADAEFRYILPSMPFLLLFGMYGVERIIQLHKQ